MAEPEVVGLGLAAAPRESVASSSSRPSSASRVPERLSSPIGVSTFVHRAGFQPPDLQAAATSDLEQAVPAQGVNARAVRQHEDELLLQHFRCWIVLFGVVICLATPAMTVLLIWLCIAYLESREVDCQVPLKLWVQVVFCIVLFNSTLNRPAPQGSCFQRIMCHWSRDPEDPQPMPKRVWLYNIAFMLFTFAWNCAGLHWVTIDKATRSEALVGASPPCSEAAPSLYLAAKVYSALNLAITLFMYINMFGFAQLLRFFLHRGLLTTASAAPSGSLETNTEVIALNDPLIEADPSCSICMEDYTAETTIVVTKSCRHVFHKHCLKGWLGAARTCPLCRQDLGRGSAPLGVVPVPSDARRQAWE